METFTTSLLVGAVFLMAAKLISLLYSYVTMCRKLKTIYQLPSHWLKGNLDRFEDVSSYFKIVDSMVEKKGIRMYCMWFGPFPVVGVTHPETVQEVMKQTNDKGHGLSDPYSLFEPWVGEGLPLSNGHKWERNRRLLTPAFHFDILKGYVPRMNECADKLVKILEVNADSEQSIDIMAALQRATLETILRCSLSCDDEIQNNQTADHKYLIAVKQTTSILWERLMNPLMFFDRVFFLSNAGRKLLETVKTLHNFSGNLITKRKQELLKQTQAAQTTNKRILDFLDILLTARDENNVGLSDVEIQNEVDVFAFAGHETTTSTISWVILSLGKRPDLQELVYQEIHNVLGDSDEIKMEDIAKFEYLSCFVKETMRHYTIVPLISRSISKPIIIDGIEIPAGPRIDIPLACLHHNPEIWPDHKEFRPERFSKENRDKFHPYAFIPFSAGSRNCIGQVFALNEIKLFLAKLVHRFEIHLDEEHELNIVPTFILTPENGLKVKLKKRQLGQRDDV